MEASAAQRRERGEIARADLEPCLSKPKSELLCMLKSQAPTQRTCAATLLANYNQPDVVENLCRRLRVEKKLYCKIAISEALVRIGALSVKPLLALLGEIGSNHERRIPQKGFSKKSFPLPRDIAARVLCRMGSEILPDLFRFIGRPRATIRLEQAIDVIGHIVYSHKLCLDSKPLIEAADKNDFSSMIQFKITRCLSGFSDDAAKQYLHNRLQSSEAGLQFEAARSLVLSGLGLPGEVELPETVASFVRQLTKQSTGIRKRSPLLRPMSILADKGAIAHGPIS